MKSRRSVTALCAFFVVIAVAVAGCGSGSSSSVPKGAVATVAGNPISMTAFKHWMFIDAKGQQLPLIPSDPPKFTKCIADAKASVAQLKTASDATVQKDCQQLFTTLTGQVMTFLIKAYWYQGLAHQQGITVTSAQVQKTLAAQKKKEFKTPAQFKQFLTQYGYTQADLNYQTLSSMVYKKLVAKQPTKVTQADIAAYYKSHKSAFGTPERRNMRIVLAKNASQANAALKALKAGQSWNVVAKKYSTDPTTKNSGGLLTDVSQGQQDAALTKAAFAAPLHQLEGPVKGQFGYYVLEVLKVLPADQRSLAQATPEIKQTLTSTKQKAAATAVDDQAKKAFGSRTLCLKLYAVAGCKGYKAPAPSSSTTPGGATTAPSTTPSTGTSTAASSGTSTAASSGSASSTTSSSTTTSSSSTQ